MRKRYDKASGRIDAELAKYEPKRASVAAKINKDTLRRYDDLRKRNHNLAAVRVEIGACGGCRMKVGAAVLRRIAANDSYVYCESCTRFLFAPEAEE
jgi:predicted  nucleic acid-binding Zn-ribbon protein